MVKHNFLLALLLLVTTPLFAQSEPQIDGEAITQLLRQHVGDDTPGLAMGIVQDGKIIYEQYIGYANLEHQVKIDQNTRFNIASDAKQYTALCILKLVEAGKINLEDDFRTYLPEIHKDIEDKITISNLLTHTSGIRDYCELYALQGTSWWKQFIDNDDAMDLLRRQRDLNFKPGTQYLYSNSNYILLTEIVKKVAEQDFGDYAKSLFASLDMPNTEFLTNYMSVIPYKARPYGNWGTWKEYPVITEVHGDGALFTTLRDQLKWEQIIQQNDGAFLSKETIHKSQSPLASSIKGKYYGYAYGYGLMFDNYQGLEYSYHSGATGAYNATFIRFPESNMALVIMTNNGSVTAENIGWEIALPLFGVERDSKQNDHPAGPEKIRKLKRITDVLGIYKGDGDGSVVRITEKDGSLYREIYQRDPAKLIQEKGGLFAYETIQGLKMNFQNIGKSDQQFTLYKSDQKPTTYHKIASVDFDGFDQNELNGRFFNEETGTEIILQFAGGTTYSLTKNGRERKAELVSVDYLRMMNSYEITAIRDEDGRVTGLKVNNDRIKQVVFQRM